jgi:ABC-type metal ion transport system substrate-binding protein
MKTIAGTPRFPWSWRIGVGGCSPKLSGVVVVSDSALYCDRGNPAYGEYLVARPDHRESVGVRALAEALNCESTREFITTIYAGQVLAAF